jgi:hypothetical protein
MLEVNTPMISMNEISRDNHGGTKRFTHKGIRIKRQDYPNTKPRLQFSLSTEVMQRCGFTVGNRIEVLFGGNGLPEVGLIQLNPEGYKLSNSKAKKTKGVSTAASVLFTLYAGMPVPNDSVNIELVTTELGKCQFLFPPGSVTIYRG